MPVANLRTALAVATLMAAIRAACPAGAQPLAPAADSGGPNTRLVDVGGYRLRVRTAGAPKAGQPTVVFESGLGTPLETWDAVQRDLARDAATFTYDRAGIGGSRTGREAPTLAHIVEELRGLLARTGIRPPYVLVGHSMGGPVIRLFAARHPGEVAGLVYVDPTDFTQTTAAQDSIWREIGVPNGRAAMRAMRQQEYAVGAVPAGVRAEALAFWPVVDAGFPAFRTLPPAPDVPTVVLLAGKAQPLPPSTKFPGGKHAAWFAASTRQWVAHMTRLTRAGERDAQGTLVLTPNSSHYIQDTEPDLVAWGVRRALYPELGGRLARTAARAGADSALRLYEALKASYPKAAFTEGLLNRLGYALMREGKLADAIAVLRRNVEDYPEAANPYDSLGGAYMTQGHKALAIQHYERSLALDPKNTNAAERLRQLRTP